MIEIAEGISSKFPGLNWMSMARVDELLGCSDEEWKILRDSGFKRVFVGIESGDPSILKNINKNEELSQYFEFAWKCVLYNIVPDYSFTLGYPPDPGNDINESIRLIRKLKEITPSGTVMFYRYTPYVKDQDNLQSFPGNWEDWSESPWDSYSLTSSINQWLKPEHLKKISNFETVLNCAFYDSEKIFPQSPKNTWLIRFLIQLARFRWKHGLFNNPYELRLIRRMLLEMAPKDRRDTIAT